MASVVRLLCLLSILLSVAHAKYRCHDRCSGHGICNEDNYCYCYDGFTAADCSQKTCAYGRAWADKANGIDSAHALSECSNRGLCNRKSGQCQCFAGFEGIACQRSTCGKSRCSGNGLCISMNEVYRQVTQSHAQLGQFEFWEGDQSTMCVCNHGFSGPDCSLRLCPKGDDPLTSSTGYVTVEIATFTDRREPALTNATFRFSFMDQSMLIPAHGWSSEKCTEGIESLANVRTANCTVAVTHTNWGTERTYSVALQKFPVLPVQNNVWTHEGVPDVSLFVCDKSQLTGDAVCSVRMATAPGVVPPEYSFCSNRGMCDFKQGVCECFANFVGSDCSSYAEGYTAFKSAASSTVLQLNNTFENYNNSLLHLHTASIDSFLSEHSVIKASDKDSTIFSLSSAPTMVMNYGGIVIAGNISNNALSPTANLTVGEDIQVGGLTVGGGMSIRTDGLLVNDGDMVAQSLRVAMQGAGFGSGVSVNNFGAKVTGGLTVLSFGMKVSGGVAVQAGGGSVMLGGVSVHGGMTVAAGGTIVFRRGVSIMDGGVVVHSGGVALRGHPSGLASSTGFTIPSGGVAVAGGLTLHDFGVSVAAGGVSIDAGGLYLDQGLEVTSNGAVVVGGLVTDLVDASSLTVATGNAAIRQGLEVYGGLTVRSGGLLVDEIGLVVEDSGLHVLGGLTLVDTGLQLQDARIVVNRGLRVTGGLSVYNEGLGVTGGLTVSTGGMFVDSGGLSVNPGSSRVGAGGVTVNNDGVTVGLGMTIQAGGLAVTDGLDVISASVAGGMTIPSDGVEVSGGGVSISSAGVTVIGSAAISTGGLVVSGGVSIDGGGIQCVDGVAAHSGGVRSEDGVAIQSQGLLISTGRLSVTGGLQATDGATVAGGLTHPSGLTVQSAGLFSAVRVQVTGGLEVLDGGADIQSLGVRSAGMLEVTSSGLYAPSSFVVTGGVTVTDGCTSVVGMRVRGGATVLDGGLGVEHGVSVTAGGLLSTEGLVVESDGVRSSSAVSVVGGVQIPQNGATVNAVRGVMGGFFAVDSGLSLTGGLSVRSLGCTVMGGLSLQSGNVRAQSMEVEDAGMEVSAGGASVRSAGLLVEGAVTVNGEMQVASGRLVVDDSGLNTESLKLLGSTLVGAPGVTIESAGVVARAGLSVLNLGLGVNGGATVYNGLLASGGCSVSNGLVLPSRWSVTAGGMSVYNDVRVNYGNAYFDPGPSPSDERLKRNVTLITQALEKIRAIRGVTFTYNDKAPNIVRKDDRLRTGVIAQQIREILPEAVDANVGEGFLSVRYTDLVPLLVEAVNELSAQRNVLGLRECSGGKVAERLADAARRISALRESIFRLLAAPRDRL